MKEVFFDSSGQRFRADLQQPVDIAIPLQFSGPQPSHFGAAIATSHPFESDGFVGDTRAGGSCNCEEIVLVPHCNGTHTECVGHITDQRVSLHDCLKDSLMTAMLVSVVTETASDGDRVITAAQLIKAMTGFSNEADALIVRTLPNPQDKKTQDHAAEVAPYFSSEAMAWIAERYEHLLTDLPSVDRSHDQGRLAAHRIFWGMDADSRDLESARFPDRTITEMIYAGDDIADGFYLLNLQVPPFVADAAPSRPRLYSLEEQ
ncbi:MAG: cyclase family protein [Gammaproteobacteria bacterium]|nr:cyclase family protein [Gammaproteobacteria bacterium]